MNQRIVFSIANQVAVDLLGPREMHVRRASLPVVALSRCVPDQTKTPPLLIFR